MNTADSIPQPGAFSQFLNPKQEAMASAAAEHAVKQLQNIERDDVKGIAAAQISLLSSFYDLSLDQARRSFRWALIASVVGFVFFLAAIGFLFFSGAASTGLATVSAVGGAMTEFVAGVNFFLYGKTISQLTLFQGRLEVTQRFLLANSLCESLSGKLKDYTRARLIGTLTGISGGDLNVAWADLDSGQTPAVVSSEPPSIAEPVAAEPQ